jgi:hypothetical protein
MHYIFKTGVRPLADNFSDIYIYIYIYILKFKIIYPICGFVGKSANGRNVIRKIHCNCINCQN